VSDVIVAPDGTVRFIYDDDLASMLQDVGALSVARASHVEPLSDRGGWTADMHPVGGCILGPFETRGQALSEEIDWLRAHSIPIPCVHAEGEHRKG